ncbi:hypothetical protein XNC1_2514 [Xenorhabdus nematophila ATCC 19061]|uniref:Uncharacterized protein n=1 Tax=Xenorhabdus nematophila (strain ATCC 19061 / DSM 3370 / CCUG 14189 / LMG 1036 / NCIMB 9965 / AN6) TaxID=406817 RepID=D3VHC7_XENNA|nr:hypothetical protein XNC1_2514 [Xenorhabdus nematophila ATCC 19061]
MLPPIYVCSLLSKEYAVALNKSKEILWKENLSPILHHQENLYISNH